MDRVHRLQAHLNKVPGAAVIVKLFINNNMCLPPIGNKECFLRKIAHLRVGSLFFLRKIKHLLRWRTKASELY